MERKIRIEKTGETITTRVFRVVVDEEARLYQFTVTVDKEYAVKLFGKEVSFMLLIQQSFLFLLERESVTSILRDFNLKEIEGYFPEYREVMGHVFQ